MRGPADAANNGDCTIIIAIASVRARARELASVRTSVLRICSLSGGGGECDDRGGGDGGDAHLFIVGAASEADTHTRAARTALG